DGGSKRSDRSISPTDSFFSYDFRAAICSRCADRGGERLAIAENSFAGDRLHGIRAHGSHALQSARWLVAWLTQHAHCVATLACIKIVGRRFADPEFCRISTGRVRN